MPPSRLSRRRRPRASTSIVWAPSWCDIDGKAPHPPLVQSPFPAEPHHLLDENSFLPRVQAGKQRLGGVRDRPLIDRTIVEELGFVAHLVDDVIGRVALRACNS